MACCYVAATTIAFIIKACDALDIRLHLQYNDSVNNVKDINDSIGGAEQETTGEDGITIISLSGMTCAACTTTVESSLLKVQGVQGALVSLPFQEARIVHEPHLERDSLLSAVQGAGYNAVLGERGHHDKIVVLEQRAQLDMLRQSLKGLSIYSTIIFAFGQGADWSELSQYFFLPLLAARPIILLLLTVYACGRHGQWIFQHAASAATIGKVNMHTLIGASTLLGLSLTAVNMVLRHDETVMWHFDTIIGVLFIVTVGRYIDMLSRKRANDTFKGLYSILDETSTVKLYRLDASTYRGPVL